MSFKVVASSSTAKHGLIGDDHGKLLNAELSAIQQLGPYLFSYTELNLSQPSSAPTWIMTFIFDVHMLMIFFPFSSPLMVNYIAYISASYGGCHCQNI